jgi:hypothetical protein
MTTKQVNLTAKPRTALRKVTVNFTGRAWDSIRRSASVFELTQTETINKAAALIGEAANATANGGAVYIRHHEGDKLERVTFL